jgi:hypothetical protein
MSKILGKIKQLSDGEINIIVLWGDTIRVAKHHVEQVFDYMNKEIVSGSTQYGKLSGVLFTTGGYSGPSAKQFHLFENKKATQILSEPLANALVNLCEGNRARLIRNYWRLVESLRRHKS